MLVIPQGEHTLNSSIALDFLCQNIWMKGDMLTLLLSTLECQNMASLSSINLLLSYFSLEVLLSHNYRVKDYHVLFFTIADLMRDH